MSNVRKPAGFPHVKNCFSAVQKQKKNNELELKYCMQTASTPRFIHRKKLQRKTVWIPTH